MSTATLSVPLGVSLASFALAGRRALELRTIGKYRTSWGAWFWAFFPGFLAALVLTTDVGTAVSVRNCILGLLGGIVGICGAVYLGYLLTDWRAAAPAPRGGSMHSSPSQGSTINVPNNEGIVTNNQSGGTNVNTSR